MTGPPRVASSPRKPRKGSLSTTTCHRGNCGRSYGPLVAIARRTGARHATPRRAGWIRPGNKCRKKRALMTPGRGGECRHAWPIRGKKPRRRRSTGEKFGRHGSFRESPVLEMIRNVRILPRRLSALLSSPPVVLLPSVSRTKSQRIESTLYGSQYHERRPLAIRQSIYLSALFVGFVSKRHTEVLRLYFSYLLKKQYKKERALSWSVRTTLTSESDRRLACTCTTRI